MASNTTYGDWMRPIAGGIRNIGRPLTLAGLGVLVVTLMLSMVNVVAAIVTAAVGIGAITVLAIRDREHRNVLDRTVERRTAGRIPQGPRPVPVRHARPRRIRPMPAARHPVQGLLVEANDGFGERFTLVRHGHTGEYSLPFACQPQGAGLADDDVEDAYVASWAGLLEALGSEAGVTQLAVTVDTSPDSGVRFRRNLTRRTVADAPNSPPGRWRRSWTCTRPAARPAAWSSHSRSATSTRAPAGSSNPTTRHAGSASSYPA